MNGLENLIKPNIIALQPYTSARDEYQGNEGIFLDANENPYQLAYNRYPDPYQRELKAKIGMWRALETENIFLGNGSDEVIDLLIRATCESSKDRILSMDPSYGMYKVSAAVNDIPIDLVALNSDMTIDEDSLFSILNVNHKLIFICSPNNPNGSTIASQLIEKLLNTTSNLVIVDEAYIDFSDTESWCNRLSKYDNLVVLQTFSKSLGAAGIRVGMGFMHPYLVGILNKIKPPYNISTTNQEAAIKRLNDLDVVSIIVDRIKKSRAELRVSLEALSIVDYIYPSSSNFLLIRFHDYKTVFSTLIDHKIIVRDRSSNTNCEGCLRITIGTETDNQKLLEVLNQIK
jgi:histidinol-phosphate aminotransferase